MTRGFKTRVWGFFFSFEFSICSLGSELAVTGSCWLDHSILGRRDGQAGPEAPLCTTQTHRPGKLVVVVVVVVVVHEMYVVVVVVSTVP